MRLEYKEGIEEMQEQIVIFFSDLKNIFESKEGAYLRASGVHRQAATFDSTFVVECRLDELRNAIIKRSAPEECFSSNTSARQFVGICIGRLA